MVVARQLISDISTSLSTLDDTTSKEIAHYTLDNLQTRAISFEEQVKKNGKYSFYRSIALYTLNMLPLIACFLGLV